jgi:hypothetical protein
MAYSCQMPLFPCNAGQKRVYRVRFFLQPLEYSAGLLFVHTALGPKEKIGCCLSGKFC